MRLATCNPHLHFFLRVILDDRIWDKPTLCQVSSHARAGCFLHDRCRWTWVLISACTMFHHVYGSSAGPHSDKHSIALVECELSAWESPSYAIYAMNCSDTFDTSCLSRSLDEAKDCSSRWEWGPAANPDLWPLLFSPQRRLILWEPDELRFASAWDMLDGLQSFRASLLAWLAVSHCILHSPLQLVHKSILKACLSGWL